MSRLGQLRDQLAADAVAGPLVGDGRIGEAIANDDRSRLERRADDTRDVVGAGGKHEQRFEHWRHALAENHFAKLLGEIGAAGFARDDDVRSLCAYGVGDELDVARLACAVDALQRDKPHRFFSWYLVTARLCSWTERENWLVPLPRDT